MQKKKGPRQCCVGRGSLAEGGKDQPPMSELWMREKTDAHID